MLSSDKIALENLRARNFVKTFHAISTKALTEKQIREEFIISRSEFLRIVNKLRENFQNFRELRPVNQREKVYFLMNE